MIIITGAAGFIGSVFAHRLNEEGYQDLVLVDDFSQSQKVANWKNITCTARVERNELFTWIKGKERLIQAVVHLGARTDTAEQNWDIFQRLNLSYSQSLWAICTEYQIPFLYASSAATYGDGSLGFSDDDALSFKLKPLNPYGKSKHDFDCWVLEQAQKPFFWAGLRFFNVYGPHEYHKGRMASVIFHAFNQIRETGQMKLFKSHKTGWEDGLQERDFIFVTDIITVLVWLLEQRTCSGIYNLGTGQARTFLDLTTAVFDAMGIPPNITFIDMPEDIRDAYQYHTQATTEKLRSAGFSLPFTSLEDGVQEYVKHFLMPARYF